MKQITLIILVTFQAIFISCNTDENQQSSLGELQLSFNTTANNNGRIANDLSPTSIVLSINDESGQAVIDSEDFTITQLGNAFIIDPILLDIGNFSITEFLVLNDNEEIILATPLENSDLENLVEQPLPIAFSITSDNVSEVLLEVISTSDLDPEDLGYSSLSFQIVPVSNILVSTFSQNEGVNRFIASQLTIFGDNDSINTVTLGDSINVVKIRSDYSNVRLVFNAEGFSQQAVNLTIDSLLDHTTIPLAVILSTETEDVNLENGLIGYFQLDGNALNSADLGPNGIIGEGNGTAEPIPTTDRNNIANSAYAFDGTERYIDLTEDPIYDLGDYDNFSFSLWFNPANLNESGVPGTSQVILSKAISAGNNRMWSFLTFDGTLRFNLFNQGTSTASDQLSTPLQNGWQNAVVVSENGTLTLYINGEERNSLNQTVTVLENSPTAKTVIGAQHFSNELFDSNFEGAIDDVRIYNRALNSTEITTLSNQ